LEESTLTTFLPPQRLGMTGLNSSSATSLERLRAYSTTVKEFTQAKVKILTLC